MCDYQGHEFGASYPDSVCIDGYLWDADSGDSDGLTHGGDIPCPQCKHAEWLESLKEEIEDEGFIAQEQGKPREYPYTPESLVYPEDLETMKAWWLKGYDEASSQSFDDCV